MPRVVPSQVVDFIDHTFSWLCEPGQGLGLTRAHCSEAAGLVELVQMVPSELVTATGRDYSEFVCSVAAIKSRVELWQSQQNPNIENNLVAMFGNRNPVTVIRQVLARCSDEAPAQSTTDLPFISEMELRTNIRTDMGAIDGALSHGEWKAATILAGSVIEALLLWALQQRSQTDIAGVSQQPTKLPSKPLHEWHLSDYIEAAHRLKIIGDETASQSRLAKDFRNLIHPGRAQRLGQKCDRGTAFSTVAGVEHVVRDLTHP
jgi:hypothetical protein